MSLHDRWVIERKNEYYYRLAKRLNYRSRASFKLIQIDNKFNIFKPGNTVVDLGASPGGWSQVAYERTQPNGIIIGVDIRYISPIKGVYTFIGDITDNNTIMKLIEISNKRVDIVLSDMAPNITGHYSIDHARSIDLCMYAVNVCDHILKRDGKFIIKAFMGDIFHLLKVELDKRFQSVKIYSPMASRDTSSEIYLICQGFCPKICSKLVMPCTNNNSPEFTSKGKLI